MMETLVKHAPSIEDIQQAVLLLQSIGVQNLCHNRSSSSSWDDASWDPFLPLCDDYDHYEEVEGISGAAASDYYSLRGSSSIHRLLEVKEFATLKDKERYYTFNVIGALICVCGVALIAGLFLGLLTLDVLQLRIIERASIDEDEKLYARTVLPIIEERHLLLVTLLLINAMCYETLPIFLDALVPSWVAVLLSTTLVMWFGEILPSGIFTGPHQLYLGYKLSPLTRFFLWVMYPFAKPLALCLDFLVKGHEGGDAVDEGYHRGELSALVRIQFEDYNREAKASGGAIQKQQKFPKHSKHRRDDSWFATKQEIIEKANERLENTNDSSFADETVPTEQLAPPLDPTEVDLIEGALQMKTIVVMDVYTPLSQLYSISDDLVLDKEGFTGIYHRGYSRVPVYRQDEDDPDEKTRILGFFMVRQLMLIDWDHKREVSTLPLQRPSCISPRMNLVDALRILRSRGYLMAFVCARPDLGNKAMEAEQPLPVEAGFMGIVTLEDIMESLLQERIYDEWDIRDRDRAVATLQRWAAEKLQHFVRKKTHSIRMKRRHSNQDHSESAAEEWEPLINGSSTQKGSYQSV